MKILSSLAAWAVVATSGCAAVAPVENFPASDSAIRAAQEAAAHRAPQASLHLQLAKEENQHAQVLVARGETRQAEGQLQRAEADAELALALTSEAPLQLAAQHEDDKAHALDAQQRATH